MADDKHEHSYDDLVASFTTIRQGKWRTTTVKRCSCGLTETTHEDD